ncbi:MAG: gliding motility-associated C-terminal domain-containing protein [Bacteroidota bacterium]
MKKIYLLLLTTIFVANLAAQEFAVGTPSIVSCGGFLVDPGLSASDYSPNFTGISVICSDGTATPINLDFSFCNLGTGDQLTIFDGSDQNAALIGVYNGTQLNNQVITSTNPQGCLTVLFTSNSDTSVGSFGAEISCGTPCEPPVVAVTVNQPDFQPTRLCIGESITFDASTTQFFNGSTVGNFLWDFDDGTTDNSSWPLVTHTFTEPGAYMVQLTLSDNNNCASINLPDVLVFVATEPTLAVTSNDMQVCIGQPVQLTGSFTPNLWTAIPEANLGGDIFIPDDQTQCFSDTLLFGGFNAGQTIQNATDVENFFINFEHSFMGDLVISFECPNGQTIIVHQQNGGGTFLGEPVDIMGPADPPGVGYDYFWSPTATAGTWAANAGGTLPSGTYNSVQPFTNLIGCPLNGSWIIEVCDMWGSDDGWIFDWSVDFADYLYPPLMSFTPSIGQTCDSLAWSGTDIVTTTSDCIGATVSPTTEGDFTYTFTVTDNHGCSYSEDITINAFAGPTVNAGPDVPYCNLPVNLSATVGNTEPGINYVYNWSVISNNGGGFNASNIPTPTFSGANGTSQVVISVNPSLDPQCTVTDTVTLALPATPGTGVLSTDSVCIGELITLTAPFTGSGYTYQWFLGDTITGAGDIFPSYNPLAGFPNETLLYAVVITEPVCGFNSETFYEVVNLPCDVFLPNILTENGDGMNDALSFGEALIYYQSAEVLVYNRWGDLVYEDTSYANDWIPSDLNDGVYYYILKVTTPGGELQEHIGYFHLMRD